MLFHTPISPPQVLLQGWTSLYRERIDVLLGEIHVAYY